MWGRCTTVWFVHWQRLLGRVGVAVLPFSQFAYGALKNEFADFVHMRKEYLDYCCVSLETIRKSSPLVRNVMLLFFPFWDW